MGQHPQIGFARRIEIEKTVLAAQDAFGAAYPRLSHQNGFQRMARHQSLADAHRQRLVLIVLEGADAEIERQTYGVGESLLIQAQQAGGDRCA